MIIPPAHDNGCAGEISTQVPARVGFQNWSKTNGRPSQGKKCRRYLVIHTLLQLLPEHQPIVSFVPSIGRRRNEALERGMSDQALEALRCQTLQSKGPGSGRRRPCDRGDVAQRFHAVYSSSSSLASTERSGRDSTSGSQSARSA